MKRHLLLLLALATLPATTYAQNGDPTWMINVGPAFSQSWIGSEDKRRGGYFSLQYAKREPRFKFWGYKAEMAIEGYYLYSQGGGPTGLDLKRSHQFGIMLIGRYWQRNPNKTRIYVEGGWGFNYSNRITHDIDVRQNSTPMAGVGMLAPFQDMEFLLGFRWLHVSNGGTKGVNRGQNYLMIVTGLRF